MMLCCLGIAARAQEVPAPAPLTGVEKVDRFLSETGAFFLATTDGKRPHLRPLGMHFVADGKLWFGVGDFKQVYKQLKKNPRVEIVALKKNGHWLRYAGRAVFTKDDKYAQKALEMAPNLRAIYNEQTGNKMMMFYLDDATASDIGMMTETERLL